MNELLRVCFLGLFGLSVVSAHAAPSCLAADATARIDGVPNGAAKVAVLGRAKPADAAPTKLFEFGTAPGAADSTWVMGKTDATGLSAFITSKKDDAARTEYRVFFIDAAGAPIPTGPDVALFDTAGAVCINSPPVAAAVPATDSECRGYADRQRAAAPYEEWVMFNSRGVACHVPKLLRQRDRLHFVMLLAKNEVPPASARATVTSGCATPTATPDIPQAIGLGDIIGKLQSKSGGAAATDQKGVERPTPVEIGSAVECASDSTVVSVHVVSANGTEATVNETLRLYERATATIHIGVLNSKLREPDFGLQTVAGQSTIIDKEASKRGPEYTAMVVVQGIFKYWPTKGDMSYPGRDMIHDSGALDRTGLVMSFGMKDPGKRFGLGLSFEIARGINLVGVYERVKTNRLSGVSIGDSFAGAAGDIPTRREWNGGWSVGLTFDTAYIMQIFGGAKK